MTKCTIEPWPQFLKANSPDYKSSDTLSPFSNIPVYLFLNDRVLGDGEVGILSLDHWVPQRLHHLQLGGEGDQRSARAWHLSLQVKEVRRLWA